MRVSPFKRVFLAFLLAAAILYGGLYAAARLTYVLVRYDGYRGIHGVHVADLGAVPPATVIACATANIVFAPLMKAETVLRCARRSM